MTKKNKTYFKTPSQTVGPFFGNYLNFNLSKKIYTNFNEKTNNQIVLKLNLKDKNNKLVKDAFIEYWQVLQNNSNLLYFDRINYNTKKKSYLISLNEYKSDTIIYISIFARGLLNHLNTIIYLEDKYPDKDFVIASKRMLNACNIKYTQFKTNKNIQQSGVF